MGVKPMMKATKLAGKQQVAISALLLFLILVTTNPVKAQFQTGPIALAPSQHSASYRSSANSRKGEILVRARSRE